MFINLITCITDTSPDQFWPVLHHTSFRLVNQHFQLDSTFLLVLALGVRIVLSMRNPL